MCLIPTASKLLTTLKWWTIPMLHRKELEMQKITDFPRYQVRIILCYSFSYVLLCVGLTN